MSSGRVISVSRDTKHRFSKHAVDAITLVAGIGIEGDAHAGVTVQHRSRVRADPAQPNLRQVHLIAEELFAEVSSKGFEVAAGQLGENVTTAGLDLLALPRGSVLCIGPDAQVEITGLRNPCSQIDDFDRGLLKAVVSRDAEGRIIRKAGIMGIVLAGGIVRAGTTSVCDCRPSPTRRSSACSSVTEFARIELRSPGRCSFSRCGDGPGYRSRDPFPRGSLAP